MKKILFYGFLTALIIFNAGLFYIFNYLDRRLEQQIEKFSSELLDTAVDVDTVDLHLFNGLGQIKGLQIENPTGFSRNPALHFENLELRIRTKDWGATLIIIEQIVATSLSSLYELKASGADNLNELLETTKKTSKTVPAYQEQRLNDHAPDLHLRIQKLIVKDTNLTLDLRALGGTQEHETLARFEIDNIGGQQGMRPKELGIEMTKAILGKLLTATKLRRIDSTQDLIMNKLDTRSDILIQRALDQLE